MVKTRALTLDAFLPNMLALNQNTLVFAPLNLAGKGCEKMIQSLHRYNMKRTPNYNTEFGWKEDVVISKI